MRIRNLGLVVAGLLAASPAYAADHLMHVNEVMLNGGNDEQYIEFNDDATEPLTGGDPYSVKIYDGAGTMVDAITLTSITAGPTVFYAIGNAAAVNTYSTVAFNGTITNALPATGQACFERVNNDKIHCVAWGCPASPIVGAQTALAPPSGMSLSRQSTGLHHSIGTPKAANSAGTLSTCTTTPPPDAGVPDAGSGNPNNPDAGTGGGGGDEDEGGCCQSSHGGGAGAAFLSLLVLGLVLRRRSRV